MRNRFLILLVSILGLFSVLLLYWLPSQVGGHLADETSRRARLAAEVLDKSAIGPLVVNDQAALNQIARGLLRDNDILYVLILDKEGKPLADSGISQQGKIALQPRVAEALRRESDWTSEAALWPPTREPVVHVSRPVFFEQLRIGTILLGISGRGTELVVNHIRKQLGLFCGIMLLGGILLSLGVSRSFSRSLTEVSRILEDSAEASLEAGRQIDPALKDLVEKVASARNSFDTTLKELETQKLQLEADLTGMQEENALLNSRLSAVFKQVASQQNKLKGSENQSRELDKMSALIQFATSIVTEVESSMRHVATGAEQLRSNLARLNGLIERLERSCVHSPEEAEQIRQYKDSISYERVKESMDELLATIQGGANWAEQLVDLLRHLAVPNSPRGK